MMEFRTPVLPLRHEGLVVHDRPVIMLGSCFSDNIGRCLRDALFDVNVNPYGTLYNPASIASALGEIISCRSYGRGDLFMYEGRYHSFSHHSAFSGVSSDSVLSGINSSICLAHEMLQSATVLCVTFGTAYVYRLADSGQVVSNCHKLPPSRFCRQAMAVDEIIGIWQPLVDRLLDFNPGIKIVFTVSPIRHLADGAHGNQLSKSTLLLAVDKLVSMNQDEAIYFPAYEIMMDDLRDYRFYAGDMTHPSDVAVAYIYDCFSKSFFDEDTIALARRCEKITRRLLHRPMSDDELSVRRFADSTREALDALLSTRPCLKRAVDKILIAR